MLFQTSRIANRERMLVLLKWDFGMGFIVGAAGLLFSNMFADLFALPENHVTLISMVNLVYASFSLWNYRQNPLNVRCVRILILANSIWPLCCLFFLFHYWSLVNELGVAFYVSNMLFVGGLAQLEKNQLT